MSMQETPRWEQAAAALDGERRRVTMGAIDGWLRERDGYGCSPREASKVARVYREEAERRIQRVLDGTRERLDALADACELREWERAEVLRRLRGRQA